MQTRMGLRLKTVAGHWSDPTSFAGSRTGHVPLAGWGSLVAAVVALLHGRGRPAVGIYAVVSSTTPIGSGLSSSAAFVVARTVRPSASNGNCQTQRQRAAIVDVHDH